MRILVFTTLFIGSLFGMDSAPRQAKKKYAEQQYAESARLYESAIGDYPRQRGALEFNVAISWARLDSTQRAISWYSRAC